MATGRYSSKCMASQRLQTLQAMVDANPQDAFSRYALAMEYVNTGALEPAVGEFQSLLEHNPRYAAGYFHGGQTMEKLGRLDEARDLYRRGIQVTTETGDEHTRSELMGALDLLG